MNEKDSDDRKRRIAATIAFFSEAIRFIVLPLMILYLVISNFPFLIPETVFRQAATSLIMFGGIIAFSSSMEAYFPLGSKLKMIFGVISIATLCAWFWFLFSKEIIVITFGSLVITLDLFGLSMVILFAVSLKGLLPIGQYMMAREQARRKRSEKRPVSDRFPRGSSPASLISYIGEARPSQEFEPPPPEDFIAYCPICGAGIPPEADICPCCGAWIRQKV